MEQESNFNRVISLVKKRLTIRQALTEIGVSYGGFYNKLTDAQKVELKHTKMSMSLVGNAGIRSFYLDIMPDFSDEDED